MKLPKGRRLKHKDTIVLDIAINKGKRKMKIPGCAFEVKEYTFADTLVDSSSQYKDRANSVDKYKDIKDITSEETLKLYSEVRNISNQDVSLVLVRDYVQNTLNLALESKNRVAEVKINLDDIPIPDMIHLHKETRDILFTHLLKITLALSKLQILKGKSRNQLRQEKVENKSHQTQIKKL